MDDKKGIEPSIMEGILAKSNINRDEAYKRSSRKRENLKIKNKRKNTVRKRLFMIAVAGLVAGGAGSVAVPKAMEVHEQHEVDEIFEGKYGDKITDIVHRSSDPKNQSIDYIEIANEFRQMSHDEEELDNIIFEFYNLYGTKDGIPIYNEIVNRTIKHIPKNNFDPSENYEFYDSWEDYLAEKGFSDEDQYKDIMRNKIISDYKYDNVKRGAK